MRVQILQPPDFSPTGIVRDRKEAWANSEWIGTFNLWIIQTDPIPAIVFQQRSPTMDWAPNKLDVAAGGHYEELETIKDGLREAKEELGKEYQFEDLISLGRRLNVGIGTDGTTRNTVCNIFLIEDNSPLKGYTLQEEEVYALCACPLEELLKVYTQEGYSFIAKGLRATGEDVDITVTKDIFPYNWDNYMFKMALLVDKLVKGEKNLLY